MIKFHITKVPVQGPTKLIVIPQLHLLKFWRKMHS